ncbi:MAG: hypothetical protein WA906_12095 [Pacificimonas sp.]
MASKVTVTCELRGRTETFTCLPSINFEIEKRVDASRDFERYLSADDAEIAIALGIHRDIRALLSAKRDWVARADGDAGDAADV